MTNEERWKIQGRTRDDLKKARVTSATLKAAIDEHARKLREAADGLTHFLSDPVGRGPSGMLKHEYLAHFYGQFIDTDLHGKLREFAAMAEEITRLEKQVAEFE